MFAGESIVSIIFRFLNFGIIIALTAYIFKRYLFLDIKSKMAAEQAEKESLEVHKDTLAERESVLKKEKAAQEKQYDDLLRKVQAWQKLFNYTLQKREQERLQLKKRLEEKAERIVQNHTLRSVEQRVIPEVLVRLRSELSAIFIAEQKGHNFLAQIVEYMNDKGAQ